MVDNTTEKYLGITIDYSRDKLIPEQGLAYLTGDGFYKQENEYYCKAIPESNTNLKIPTNYTKKRKVVEV